MMISRKKMKNAVSLGRYSANDYIGEEFLDGDGNAVIDILLDENTALFNPFSYGKQIELNEELLSYIDRRSGLIGITMPIKIVFHGRPLADSEKVQVKECIQEWYTVKILEKRSELKANMNLALGLAILGIIVLSIYFTMSYAIGSQLRLEVISIIGSFALWEAADCFFLERGEILKDILFYTRQRDCSIEFES